ncbi:MAG: hypothetical protein QGF21_05385 [Vicinamibacterales bacterium]|jgi:hypothetical protein|nr:hypothetical protein [Acidobacteriota bacterium]MDP7471681.1 hypothetical protein [Vicinamibacterales bacterium]MDP7671363.1 hypothetical protein [Vicinamibacterales bacterium]HJO39232.1 hypothetical protein [Vicinamibacterales bacterium]|tara:strand:- start:330 stop:548 length:219 start_codon:yes stop_codon:yes gene_type:complete
MPNFSKSPVESNDPLGRKSPHNFPQTKAGWLMEASWPDIPDFPLSAEILVEIPHDLPGPVPTNADELTEGSE